MERLNVSNGTEALRKAILEHPELDILVLANEDANNGDYYYMVCQEMFVEYGEFLDTCPPYDDEVIEYDRDTFRDRLEDYLYDEVETEAELSFKVDEMMAQYEPYWKPCIILKVGN